MKNAGFWDVALVITDVLEEYIISISVEGISGLRMTLAATSN
jgi:hypothetical protein